MPTIRKHKTTEPREPRRSQAGDLWGTSRWKRLRSRVRKRAVYYADPFGLHGDARVFGSDVDHIVPIAEGGERWALSNLQLLCKGCHSRKTKGEN